MDIETFRNCCMAIKGATEGFPFIDTNVLVFKVMNKMFAYIDLAPRDGRFRACMKCDPERSLPLRERYAGIIPGFHISHTAWNTVYLDYDVPDTLIGELIRHSADEVIKKLPKWKQKEYHDKLPNEIS
jgi:predicted DNA-binding protein (MmcQ/YjbR family)